MEGGKPSGSSFTSDLFGAKPSSSTPPSSEILCSIFPPPAPVNQKIKNDSVAQPSSTKKPVSGEPEEKKSYFLDEKTQPFHYSSSIYYGGQDVYSQPQTAQNTTFNKDVGEDESGSASRGNWWQGSLYY